MHIQLGTEVTICDLLFIQTEMYGVCRQPLQHIMIESSLQIQPRFTFDMLVHCTYSYLAVSSLLMIIICNFNTKLCRCQFVQYYSDIHEFIMPYRFVP